MPPEQAAIRGRFVAWTRYWYFSRHNPRRLGSCLLACACLNVHEYLRWQPVLDGQSRVAQAGNSWKPFDWQMSRLWADFHVLRQDFSPPEPFIRVNSWTAFSIFSLVIEFKNLHCFSLFPKNNPFSAGCLRNNSCCSISRRPRSLLDLPKYARNSQKYSILASGRPFSAPFPLFPSHFSLITCLFFPFPLSPPFSPFFVPRCSGIPIPRNPKFAPWQHRINVLILVLKHGRV